MEKTTEAVEKLSGFCELRHNQGGDGHQGKIDIDKRHLEAQENRWQQAERHHAFE